MSKKLVFRVDGMSCGSCEILLERAFRQISGVQKVDVSNSNRTVCLTVDDSVVLSTSDLARAVKDPKYSFSISDGVDSSLKNRINWLRGLVVFALAFSFYLVFFRSGLLPTGSALSSSTGLTAVFLVGLVAAFSSCSAVVGGLVAAIATVSSVNNQPNFLVRFRPHLIFNLGRIVGFALLGGLVGGFGKIIGLSAGLNSLFLLLVAVVMIVIGFGLAEVFPGGSFFGLSKKINRLVEKQVMSGRVWSIFLLGVATFFLPCGFTQSVQLLAAASGSFVGGAAIMFIFSLGTAPALLGLGLVAGTTVGHLRRYFTLAISIFVVAVGLSNFAGATTLLNSGSSKVTTDSSVRLADIRLEDGEQVIQMEVTSDLEYFPDTLYVRVGTPVRWDIYGSDRMGCASSLILREFGVRTFLQPGFNTVRFIPNKQGTYRFTCSMGMTSGTMVVLPAENSNSN